MLDSNLEGGAYTTHFNVIRFVPGPKGICIYVFLLEKKTTFELDMDKYMAVCYYGKNDITLNVIFVFHCNVRCDSKHSV